MKCKFCGEELVASKKEENIVYCMNCKKKFRVKIAQPEERDVPEQEAEVPASKAQTSKAQASKAQAPDTATEERKLRRKSREDRRPALSKKTGRKRRADEEKSSAENKSRRKIKGKRFNKFDNILKGKLNIILPILVGIVIIAGIGIAFNFVKNSNSSSHLYDSDNSDTLQISFNEELKVGDYTIKVASVKPMDTKEGEAGVLVQLAWYNGGDEAISPSEAFGVDVYQGYNKLEQAAPKGMKKSDDAWNTEIKKGASGSVWKEFKLKDDENIDISLFNYEDSNVTTVTYGYGNIVKEANEQNSK